MSDKIEEVKAAIRRRKLWTTILVLLCALFLILNIWTFYSNRKTVASMKQMHQKMLDLKVELEGLKKSGALDAEALDAVTYSTSGEERAGVHLPLDEQQNRHKHAQEYSVDL